MLIRRDESIDGGVDKGPLGGAKKYGLIAAEVAGSSATLRARDHDAAHDTKKARNQYPKRHHHSR